MQIVSWNVVVVSSLLLAAGCGAKDESRAGSTGGDATAFAGGSGGSGGTANASAGGAPPLGTGAIAGLGGTGGASVSGSGGFPLGGVGGFATGGTGPGGSSAGGLTTGGTGGSQLVSGGQSSGGVAPGGGAGGTGPQGGAGNSAPGDGGAAAAGGSLGGTGGNGGADSGGSGGAVAPSPPFTNAYDGARASTVSLDVDWRFHLGDATGAQRPNFDDGSWTSLDVPHDWSISLPFNQSSAAGSGGGYLDGGVGWYRKRFSLPESSSSQKVFVQFDGIYMDSTVWLNGTQICARPYGYSSFECDATNAASFGGENVLAVRVNNQLPSSRWYSGSGIYRHVWLKTVNPVRVAYTGTRVTTPQVSAASATVELTVSVQNDTSAAQSVTLSSVVLDAAGAEVAVASAPATLVGAGQIADVTHSATVTNPELWSPASPYLYSIITTVAVDGATVDTYRSPLGIRSFEFDANTGFALNGQPLKINGVCNHHDLGALGAAVNYRAMEKRMQMLKDMGANALRTSHNPPAPELLDICDRLGFLVMDEAFDCWYAGKNTYDYGRFFREWADTDVKDLVARDRNHPSVIIWSIGNEVAQAGDTNVVRQLMNAIHEEDETRPITQGYAAWVATADIKGLEDLVGINYDPSRYDSFHAAHPEWKLIASESSSALRSRGIYNNDHNQCSSYDDFAAGWGHTAETSWRNVNTRAWIAGEFVWTGFDYIGEPTPYEWPSKSSYFGIIDTANFPKDVFYFYQSRWGYDGPVMVHIVPMDWTSWTPGRNVRVMVYSNADRVELFLNGSSLGSKDVDPSEAYLEWSVAFATGTLEARATRGGTEVSDRVQTAGAAARLALAADRASITADGRDLAFVTVDVVDAQGVVVPQASNLIDFAIEGPGELAGVDNGNAVSHESYQGTSRSAFSGKALAIVRSTTSPGEITLTATSSGLTGGSVVITTRAP